MDGTVDAVESVSSVEERIAVVDAAIRVFSEKSYRRATFKDVADASGLPLDHIQAHFPTWQGLVLATVHHWQNLATGRLVHVARDEGILIYMRRLVEDNLQNPALARLLLALLAEATDPTHPNAPYLQTRYEAYHQIIRGGIEHDIAMGRIPDTVDPVHGAELIVGLWEGLRMQHLLRPTLDMAAAFDRALGMLVRDWGVE
ncbi:MAG: TetR/AcrR family transcriptional regulator [Williamsia herbipolensis]|nr:TetR/AcrR family transcriptional regulator [Williamsia herbipolensis]